MSAPRCFLLLQGVCSPLFARLADRLSADGHRVLKLNFTGGDVAYWGTRPSRSFRARAESLPEFLDSYASRLGVSDLILFGDCRPLHRRGIDWASRHGVRSHVFEEGYFRPYWVTLERGGVNARSHLPKDPAWYRTVGSRLADAGNGKAFAAPFRTRAWHDVLYHLASTLNPLLYPAYRTHAPVTAPIEYAGYVRRFSLLARIERRELERAQELARGPKDYYVLPLQLNGDAQIREHSSFRDMREVIERVVDSFARCAPPAAQLVIKNHPLDMGLMDYAGIVDELVGRYVLEGRIHYLEAGDLGSLLDHARGVVTVNSTVGFLALGAGRPTIALGSAIYDMPGLTFGGPLDDFWQHASGPDRELYRCFRNTVVHAAQINGGLYSRSGIELTVQNAAAVLSAERSPLEELL